MASRITRFATELKRRKVYHVGVVYLVVGFAVAQGAEYLFQLLEFPLAAAQFVAILIAIGFPIALVLAWAYEVRPEEKGPALPQEGEGKSAVASGENRQPLESHSSPSSDTDSRPAIAVLPFDDFSPDPRDAYFAQGMHEEILTHLQKTRGLAVRGRTSVLPYRENPKSLRDIALELDVGFILEGSARKAGDQVRLTAQLIDARKDEHLWAENYDRPLTVKNLISVQSDIAGKVAQAVGIVLSREEKARMKASPTHDLQAYDHYLLGRHHLHQWSLKDLETGLRTLEQAVEIDPAFAQGHAGVAYAYSVLAAWGQPPEDTWPQARAAAERALSLDDTQAEAHNALALEALSYRYDWVAADEGFRRALRHNPNSVEALDWLAIMACGVWGRMEEGRVYGLRALKADPLSLTIRYHSALLKIWFGEFDEALTTFDELKESGSGLFLGRHGRAYVRMAQGDYEEALVEMESAMELADERTMIFVGILGYLYGRLGREAEARSQLGRLDQKAAEGVYVSPVPRAQIHAGLGETDEAITLLEEAYERRTHWMIHLGNIPWTFEELRDEPRFQELLEKLDFPRLR